MKGQQFKPGEPKYKNEDIFFTKLSRSKITVPKFQRPLVWNDVAKKEFVQTVAQGFPFGSILVIPITTAAIL